MIVNWLGAVLAQKVAVRRHSTSNTMTLNPILLLVTVTCLAQAGKAQMHYSSDRQVFKRSYDLLIHSTIPRMNIRVLCSTYEDSVTHEPVIGYHVEVRAINDTTLLQSFNKYTESEMRGGGEDTDLFPDANFDGYKDMLLESSSSAFDATYFVWLYDPERQQFEYSDNFSGLTNPSFDASRKEILSSARSGCGGDCYVSKRFRVVDDFPVQIEMKEMNKERQADGTTVFVLTTERLVDGEWVKSVEKHSAISDFPDE